MAGASEEIMRVAAFKSEPEAMHVATILSVQGYDAEVVDFESDGGRASDIAHQVPTPLWVNAFVLSNCESEYFGQVVRNNCGMVVLTKRPICRSSKMRKAS